MKAQLSPQEALFYEMVTVAAADRTISEHELARINTMVRELPAFRGLEETWLSREAQNCGKILSKPGGVNSVVSMVVEALPPGTLDRWGLDSTARDSLCASSRGGGERSSHQRRRARFPRAAG